MVVGGANASRQATGFCSPVVVKEKPTSTRWLLGMGKIVEDTADFPCLSTCLAINLKAFLDVTTRLCPCACAVWKDLLYRRETLVFSC